MTDNKDIFYYSYFFGFVDCYYNPETSELYGRDKICDLFINLLTPVASYFFGSFPIKITKKEKVERDFLIKKYNKIATHEAAKDYMSSDEDFIDIGGSNNG